jgi:3-hydroxyacyl-CoA dehydrogenase
MPGYLQQMVEKNMLGSKTGKGFFFKDRNSPKGEILALDLKTLEYRPQVKPKFATLDAAKKEDDLRKRLKHPLQRHRQGRRILPQEFPRAVRVREPPHSGDQRRAVQDRRCHARWLRLGTGSVRDLGCHRRESRDGRDERRGREGVALGERDARCRTQQLLQSGNGKRLFYDVASKSYKPVPRAEGLIVLSDLPESSIVWKNSAATVRHSAMASSR